jgi:protein required for attachment to host cells
MIWIVNMNSNICRIYDYAKSPEKLNLLKEIQHPDSKLKKSDLVSDKQGHYKTDGSVHGAYSQHSDPKEITIDDFSREIAKELNHGRTANAYNALVIITPPHMNGLLHQHLDKHVNDLVTHNIQKDISNCSDHELLEFLKINTRYSK